MSERSAVQDPLLKYAHEIGWHAISPSEALQMRGGDTTSLYFTDILHAQLMKRNKGVLRESECADVMRQLRSLTPTLEGNREALSWLRGEQSTFIQNENRNRNVTLIDFRDPRQQPIPRNR